MNVKTASCDLLMYILAFALEQSREAGNGGQLIREDISDRTNTYVADYFKNDYSEVNIKRMQRGFPPQFSDRSGVYSMELHHIRRRTGENFYFFMGVTPLEYSIIDPFRFVKRSM